MSPKSFPLLFLILILALLQAVVKPDPDPLQDYCIGDTKKTQSFFSNGASCLDPSLVLPSHFTTSALTEQGSTANMFGFNLSLTSTVNLPGANTQGLSMARVSLAANGIVPLHSHPRASEVTICLQGSILVGFVNTTNYLYTQNLRPGDSFVFPKGLIHFLYNVDPVNPALAVSGLSSQNPGAQIASLAAFTSKPAIPDDVLKKTFQISGQDMATIRKHLGG